LKITDVENARPYGIYSNLHVNGQLLNNCKILKELNVLIQFHSDQCIAKNLTKLFRKNNPVFLNISLRVKDSQIWLQISGRFQS